MNTDHMVAMLVRGLPIPGYAGLKFGLPAPVATRQSAYSFLPD